MSPPLKSSNTIVLKSRELREQSAQICAQARIQVERSHMLQQKRRTIPRYVPTQAHLHQRSLRALYQIETELKRLTWWVGGWVGGYESSEIQRTELRHELQRLIERLKYALRAYLWARRSQAVNTEDQLTLTRIEQIVSQAKALGDRLRQAEAQHQPWLVAMQEPPALLKSKLIKVLTQLEQITQDE